MQKRTPREVNQLGVGWAGVGWGGGGCNKVVRRSMQSCDEPVNTYLWSWKLLTT